MTGSISRRTGESVFRLATLAVLAFGFCTGGTCTITLPDGNNGGNNGSYVPLNQADAIITITELGGEGQATVTARLTDRLDRAVVLQTGQAVSVNGTDLAASGTSGTYLRTIPASAFYTVTVTEPTRGVADTTVASPTGFAITEPTAGGNASLSGFTVAWSNPDVRFTVVVTLAQAAFSHPAHDFGPFADTGSHAFTAQDLADYRQGAQLQLTVTRINESQGIEGFGNADLFVEHAENIATVPTQ